MIPILRKVGWDLNPNDKVVNAILKRCEANNGECPCHNDSKIDKSMFRAARIENMMFVIAIYM